MDDRTFVAKAGQDTQLYFNDSINLYGGDGFSGGGGFCNETIDKFLCQRTFDGGSNGGDGHGLPTGISLLQNFKLLYSLRKENKF